MLTHRNARRFSARTATAGLAILAFGIGLNASPAEAASITGKWRGGGTYKLADGNKEEVRCSVTYGRVAGQEFSVNARCSSGAGRVDQTGTLVRKSSNYYVGTVINTQYSVTARVSVRVTGKTQSVSISSNQGSASLSLKRR